MTRLLHADATCGSCLPKPSLASCTAERKSFSASSSFPWQKWTNSTQSITKVFSNQVVFIIKLNRTEKQSDRKKPHACRKKSLALSVKILHFAVCVFDTTEPSSIFLNPFNSSPESLSMEVSVDTSSAKTVVALIPRVTAAQ